MSEGASLKGIEDERENLVKRQREIDHYDNDDSAKIREGVLARSLAHRHAKRTPVSSSSCY